MRNIIKCSAFIITSVLLCLLIYAPYVQAAPEPFYVNEETGHAAYLDDGAGIIVSSSETEEIEALKDDMKKITAYGGVALVTAAPSEQTEVYAEKRYREFFAADSGTLLLIDMRHRFIYVFSDGAIYKTVTKSYANTITDNAYRDATRGNYISCARLVFGQELALLQNRRIAQPMKHMNNALIAILTGLTVHFFRMTCKKRRKRPAAGIVHGQVHIMSSH